MTGWAEDLLLGGGYLLLALLIVLLENLFPPIPSELVLPLAGSRVAAGDMDYLPAVIAATIGSVARRAGAVRHRPFRRPAAAPALRPPPAAGRAARRPRRGVVRSSGATGSCSSVA